MRFSSSRAAAVAVCAVAGLAFLAACGGDSNGSGTSGEGTSMAFAEQCQKSDEKQFSAPPPMIIDTSRTYVATIETSKGAVVIELATDTTPVTTNNFVFLACKGFYDGLSFHRVEPGFVIQGGDPEGTGSGGPGYRIPGEFEGSSFIEGVLGMARSQDPDSAGSQFFITLGAAPHLDGAYAAFGSVTSGMDVAQQIQVGDLIQSITIEER